MAEDKDISGSALVEAVKTKELFSRLKGSEAWHKLQKIVQARAMALQSSILSYPLSTDDPHGYRQEFRKGHALGLLEVERILDIELSNAEEEIALTEDDDEDNT